MNQTQKNQPPVTFEDYQAALEGAGPIWKELLLDRAAHGPEALSLRELLRLRQLAYPDPYGL